MIGSVVLIVAAAWNSYEFTLGVRHFVGGPSVNYALKGGIHHWICFSECSFRNRSKFQTHF
jgi:hypothetical protein